MTRLVRNVHVVYKAKIFIAGALWLCLMVSAASAQGLHLRGGLNLANAAITPEPTSPASTKMLRGYNGALIGELGNGPVRLLIGAGYENRGVAISGPGGGDYKLDYATVPVMIGFGSPSVNAGASVFLNVGVESAFLIGSSYPTGGLILTEDDTRDFDLGMRAELGLELPVSYSGPAITLAVAYSLGLTDANRSDDEWRNNTFQLIIGLKLRTH
jgi:hypothetical protein